MAPRWPYQISLLVIVAVVSPGWAEEPASPAPTGGSVWDQAVALEQRGQYVDAAALYATIPSDSSDSQRAGVQAGACLENAGKPADAVTAYDAAIAKNPSAYWAEAAMFQKARAYNTLGNVAEARRCIGRVKARFPDSSSYADALLLETRMDGRNTAAAEALVAREQQATALYKQALLADRNKDEAGALQVLDAVILQYADTPAALRCRESRAHILTRHKGPQERMQASAEFLHILTLVADSAPNSRIAETARLRLAALHHSFKNRQDALALYTGLLNSEDKAIASRAALQIAGLQLELLQRERLSGTAVADSRWDDLRALCLLVSTSADANPNERVRAELMSMESLCWQDCYAEAVDAGDSFLTRYEGSEFKQDLATVRFFAGEAAQKVKQYDKALAHFRWVVDAYKGEKEIWPGMGHIPRAYFRIWDTLRRAKAPPDQIAQAAEALLAAFPQSAYSRHAQVVMQSDTEMAKAMATARSLTPAKGE